MLYVSQEQLTESIEWRLTAVSPMLAKDPGITSANVGNLLA